MQRNIYCGVLEFVLQAIRKAVKVVRHSRAELWLFRELICEMR